MWLITGCAAALFTAIGAALWFFAGLVVLSSHGEYLVSRDRASHFLDALADAQP